MYKNFFLSIECKKKKRLLSLIINAFHPNIESLDSEVFSILEESISFESNEYDWSFSEEFEDLSFLEEFVVESLNVSYSLVVVPVYW